MARFPMCINAYIIASPIFCEFKDEKDDAVCAGKCFIFRIPRNIRRCVILFKLFVFFTDLAKVANETFGCLLTATVGSCHSLTETRERVDMILFDCTFCL